MSVIESLEMFYLSERYIDNVIYSLNGYRLAFEVTGNDKLFIEISELIDELLVAKKKIKQGYTSIVLSMELEAKTNVYQALKVALDGERE